MATRILRIVGTLCSIGVAVSGALRAGDTVTLTSRMVIEGQVIRDTPNDPLIAVNTGSKLLLLNRTEIASIALDDAGRADYARQRDAIHGRDANAHFRLYTWARERRLFDYAAAELSATLKADPSHVQARAIAFAPATLSTPSTANGVALPLAETGDGPVIGMRPKPKTLTLQTEYDAKISALCETLLPGSTSDENTRSTALKALSNDRVKAVPSIVAQLDPARDSSDEQTRLAALAGLDALKPASPDISNRLAQVAIADPYLPVRKQSVALIKARNDERAMNTLVSAYVSAFDPGGSVRDPVLKAAEAEALKNLDDKRVYSAMFYRATLEIRTEVSDLNSFTTRQIDSYTVNSGAQNNTIVPLSFPIQFPELKLTSIKTTICAPCAALSDFSGQNLGNDLDAWAKFIRMQK